MYKFPYIFLLSFLFSFLSCGRSQGDIKKDLELLKAGENADYTVAYHYASYLSTSKSTTPKEAIPMISELISMGYSTAARYCIDNLERNGIHSADLLALHGLCYQHELQPQLAMADMEAALRDDPENEKIQSLLTNLRNNSSEPGVIPLHKKLFSQGVTFLQKQEYDSALHYINRAAEADNDLQYEQYTTQIKRILEGNKIIGNTPDNHRGYLLKSQGLAAIKQFDQAQGVIDSGLAAIPDNLNLIMAKALVWVQEGKNETARQYLWEQEQQGIVIDPAVKKRILQQQN